MIEQLTGQRVGEYAQTVLFDPLNITDYEWIRSPNWNGQQVTAGWGLRLRARDLAKIGSVFLHGGRWRGMQIIPEEWVTLSTKGHIVQNQVSFGGAYRYGFQWWRGTVEAGEHAYNVTLGFGGAGQRLFILPDERLVVTLFAWNFNPKYHGRSDDVIERILTMRR